MTTTPAAGAPVRHNAAESSLTMSREHRAGLTPELEAGLRDPTLFPRFTDAQLQCVAGFAVCREYAPGEVLFPQGWKHAPFYVIEQGKVEFFDHQHDGRRKISEAGEGMFIGDIAMFTGEPTIAECVACEP